MPNPIIYLEIGATNVPRSARFYGSVFGWDIADPETTGYTTFSTGTQGIGGGIYHTDAIPEVGAVIAYIQVQDITATCERIKHDGGQILVGKKEITGGGWFAHFVDTEGNKLGLFTPKG